MKRLFILSVYVISIIASVVCVVCDYFITHHLDWSLIVVLSLIFFSVLFTVCLKANQPLKASMISLTIIILPFLFILSMLLQEPLIITVGGSIAILNCLFLWCVYVAYFYYHVKKYRLLSFSFLLTIPLVFSILFICNYFLEHFTISQYSYVYHFVSMLLFSFVFIVIDLTKRKVV